MREIRGVVIHGTRSGRANNPTEGIGTVNYCTTPGTTSYNFLIDRDGTVYELVPPGFAAWHAGELNWHWLGVALAQGVESDPITPEQHATLRVLLKVLSDRHGFPLRRVVWLGYPTASRGVTQHMDTQQGANYGKSDVGRMLQWGQVAL